MYKIIDGFANLMNDKYKLREEKYGHSWIDWSERKLNAKLFEELSEYLNSLEKSELVDIANVCMMLYYKKMKLENQEEL